MYIEIANLRLDFLISRWNICNKGQGVVDEYFILFYENNQQHLKQKMLFKLVNIGNKICNLKHYHIYVNQIMYNDI